MIRVIQNLIWCTNEFPPILSPPSDGWCVSGLHQPWSPVCRPPSFCRVFITRTGILLPKNIIHVLISLLHVLPFSVNLDFLEDFSCWFFVQRAVFLTGWFFLISLLSLYLSIVHSCCTLYQGDMVFTNTDGFFHCWYRVLIFLGFTMYSYFNMYKLYIWP